MDNIPELYQQGLDDQRIIFFAKLRNLIMEKDKANDIIAATVLGWAYERLADDD
jgi:hypothetical protein